MDLEMSVLSYQHVRCKSKSDKPTGQTNRDSGVQLLFGTLVKRSLEGKSTLENTGNTCEINTYG